MAISYSGGPVLYLSAFGQYRELLSNLSEVFLNLLNDARVGISRAFFLNSTLEGIGDWLEHEGLLRPGTDNKLFPSLVWGISSIELPGQLNNPFLNTMRAAANLILRSSATGRQAGLRPIISGQTFTLFPVYHNLKIRAKIRITCPSFALCYEYKRLLESFFGGKPVVYRGLAFYHKLLKSDVDALNLCCPEVVSEIASKAVQVTDIASNAGFYAFSSLRWAAVEVESWNIEGGESFESGGERLFFLTAEPEIVIPDPGFYILQILGAVSLKGVAIEPLPFPQPMTVTEPSAFAYSFEQGLPYFAPSVQIRSGNEVQVISFAAYLPFIDPADFANMNAEYPLQVTISVDKTLISHALSELGVDPTLADELFVEALNGNSDAAEQLPVKALALVVSEGGYLAVDIPFAQNVSGDENYPASFLPLEDNTFTVETDSKITFKVLLKEPVYFGFVKK